ncbi:MAG: vWA domain-containing protein [Pseudomonadota bacterium]
MHIYVLIDQSGSMASRWVETIGAVNAYAKGLMQDAPEGLTFNIAAFDSVEDFRFVELRRGVRPEAWTDIHDGETSPGGMTPLFDAIGRISTWVHEDTPAKAAIAIITDGAENNSREITRHGAKAMLDRMRGKGFDVVFLGADFDAFQEAAAVGTAMGQTLNMSEGNYFAAASALSKRTMAYSFSDDNSAEFSEADRKAAIGKK